MAAHDPVRRHRLARIGAVATLALATAAWLALPQPGLAVSAIPAEVATFLAPDALTAIVGDVDGDGVRELVRLVPRAGDDLHLAVEVVQVDAAGEVRQLGEAPLLRGASFDEQFNGLTRPGETMLPARVDDGARLLAWRVDGRERVLAVAIGAQDDERPCCLAVWQVELDGAGGVRLGLLLDVLRSAAAIQVADLDADGTDELVVSEPIELAAPNVVAVYVLRWTGETFAMLRGSVSPAPSAPLVALGDSDGLRGDEVGLVAAYGSGVDTVLLHRISLAPDGALRTERADLPLPADVVALPGPAGGRLVLASDSGGSVMVDWPSGADRMTVEATSIRGGRPLAVIGSGDDARVLLQRGDSVDVLDATLTPRQGVLGSPASALFRATEEAPYVGPLPGGLPDGRAATLFRGRLITAVGGTDAPRIHLLGDVPVGVLPATVPLGSFGPDGGWMALASATAFDATREGGSLVGPAGPVAGARVAAVRSEAVLRPETDGGRLDPTLSGAVRSSRQPARPLILARDGFELEIAAPQGTLLRAYLAGATAPEPQLVGPSGAARLSIPGEPTGADDDERLTVRLVAVTPAGQGYGALWEVQLRRTAPTLEVTASAAPFAFEVPLLGRTSPGAAVVVDGQPVPIAEDGTFEVAVGAGPLPRVVRIEATDAVGNRSEQTLSVVGFLDYRQLPWIPMAVVFTLVVGLILFLRAPRPAPAGQRADDAHLEEIE
jgi:hypothetical protein